MPPEREESSSIERILVEITKRAQLWSKGSGGNVLYVMELVSWDVVRDLIKKIPHPRKERILNLTDYDRRKVQGFADRYFNDRNGR